MPLNLDLIRGQFPSLNRPAIFFDNPGGTQIAKPSLDRINKYLLESNRDLNLHLLKPGQGNEHQNWWMKILNLLYSMFVPKYLLTLQQFE